LSLCTFFILYVFRSWIFDLLLLFQSPFLITPPFPEYVSGHSTFSAAVAEVLKLYFGGDDTYRGKDKIPFVSFIPCFLLAAFMLYNII
jgi:membrane-associated phospholipid phosphatase